MCLLLASSFDIRQSTELLKKGLLTNSDRQMFNNCKSLMKI
ncbi:hypothetical protein [Nostoc linckia]|nr:hypothetical protein [Nostoc linckia]